MASTVSGYLTSIDVVVNACKTLAEQNGWTIDRHDAGTRVHFHKGVLHFEVYKYSATHLGLVGCSGYNSGSTPTAQPGASAATLGYILDYAGPGADGMMPMFRLVATGTSIYIFPGVLDYSSYPINTRGMALGEITDKIGSWEGGQFVCGSYAGSSGSSQDFWLFSAHPLNSDTSFLLNIGGSWAPNASYGYAVGRYSDCWALRSKMPNLFNAGVLPVPLPLFVKNIANGSLLHPIGYAPGLRVLAGGDVYMDGDTIVIGADTYLLVQARQGAADKSVSYGIKIS